MHRDQSAESPRRDCEPSGAVDCPSQPDASCYSITWDVVVPVIIAALPFASFRLLGLVMKGVGRPDAAPSPTVITAIVVIQAIGIVAMAYVVLGRLEAAFGKLNAHANRQPATWRRMAVILSVVCLLLTDILANVAAAFTGAGFLLVAAVPTFLASLACKGIAFAGIPIGPDRAA